MSGRTAVQSQTAVKPTPIPVASGLLQRAAISSSPMNEVPPLVHDVLRSPGQPLDPQTRAFMEPRFRQDFSRVRVHTDTKAEESARAVNALAYTVGRDVVFGTGQYLPATSAGHRLMAHELTHVVQQATASSGDLRLGARNTIAEREAEATAAALRTGEHAAITTTTSARTLMRQSSGEEHPAGEVQAESPGFWGTIGGALMGEFNEDPNFAMIGIDLGVSLIPILDQVSDARDIIAHLYYMIFRGQYDRFMRWIGLVFSLIGLFPEIGSAIKGASKFIIKGVREVISHLADLLGPIRRFLPEIGDIGRLRGYIVRNWSRFVAFGTDAWNRVLNRVSRWVSVSTVFAGGLSRRVRDMLTRIREIAPIRLRSAFDWVRQKIDSVLDEVAERLGLRQRNIATETEPLRIFGGRRRISTADMLNWEQQGGHALQRHGPLQTRDTLRQRIYGEVDIPAPPPGGADFRIWEGHNSSAASRWADEATMHQAISDIINDNIQAIEQAARTGGQFPRLEGVALNRTLGGGWVTAAAPKGQRGVFWVGNLQRATVRLAHDDRGGWYLLTSFPVL